MYDNPWFEDPPEFGADTCQKCGAICAMVKVCNVFLCRSCGAPWPMKATFAERLDRLEEQVHRLLPPVGCSPLWLQNATFGAAPEYDGCAY